MELCGVLGINRSEVERMLVSKMHQIPEWEGPKKDKDPATAVRFLVSDYFRAALSFYYLGDHDNCRKYARGCICATSENFFGEWRQTVRTDEGKIDPPWWKKAIGWIDPFRYSAMWGSALGDWESIRKLAFYADDGCAQGKEGAEGSNFYLGVACHLRDASLEQIDTYLTHAANGHAKRIGLLCELFQGIRNGNAAQTNRAMKKYLEYYRRRVFPNRLYDTYISIDGSFFYHLAKQAGIQLAVEPEFLNHIVRLDD